MSELSALFRGLTVVVSGLRTFFTVYFALVLVIVLFSFLYGHLRIRSLEGDSEGAIVARIKGTAQVLRPELFNIAVLLKHGPHPSPSRNAHDDSPSEEWWAAAVCGFEEPFTQVVVRDTGRMRCEGRMESLRSLDILLRIQRESGERNMLSE
ncbi:hypothetical protein EJ02DRAFT_424892 [Clathrospora elynae]|uniref:Uncharacterized protein n=1 Tax=Clathrospora elynae TaxID=706981 RepID=A0A6A5SQI4_9PLEO|nr:hypothetical protein EJ02DRAFT_424892 [Clathrospora elynae]